MTSYGTPRKIRKLSMYIFVFIYSNLHIQRSNGIRIYNEGIDQQNLLYEVCPVKLT